MGWTFTNKTRPQLVMEVKAECGKVLATIGKGDVLYMLCERNGRTTVDVCLLEKAPRGWGYKLMNEADGPLYHDIPRAWLDKLAPVPIDSFAQEWRNRVRARMGEA
jgi:hypothetical protein